MSLIFSRCIAGSQCSAAIRHTVSFFSSPSHQSLKNKLHGTRHKDYQYTFHLFIFSFVILERKGRAMIFNCQTVNISEMTSLLMGLSWPGALLPPSSLGARPQGMGWKLHSLGRVTETRAGHSPGLSTEQTDGQETGEDICGSSWRLCVSPPWLSPFHSLQAFPVGGSGLLAYLAELQATRVSIPAMRPGC